MKHIITLTNSIVFNKTSTIFYSLFLIMVVSLFSNKMNAQSSTSKATISNVQRIDNSNRKTAEMDKKSLSDSILGNEKMNPEKSISENKLFSKENNLRKVVSDSITPKSPLSNLKIQTSPVEKKLQISKDKKINTKRR